MTKKAVRPDPKSQAAAKPPGPRRAPPRDVAIVSGPTEDGQGARVVRFKDGAVFAGEVRPVREGQPIDQHEVVRLRPLHARWPVCEVEVLHAPRTQRRSHGPARVATARYRRNWNAVFGAPARKKPDLTLN